MTSGYQKNSFRNNLIRGWVNWQNRRRMDVISQHVRANSLIDKSIKPVVFFNASARISGTSLNAAFALLVSWSLQLAGIPVVQFICKSGMSHCVQGTNREDYTQPPPCEDCLRQSQRLYKTGDINWFTYSPDAELMQRITDKSITELSTLQHPFTANDNRSAYPIIKDVTKAEIPLGSLVLPSIRWALRRYELADDASTRYLFGQYLLSAYNIACEFDYLLNQVQPQTAVIFNGMMFPEATACWVARRKGIQVITHEVSFQPFSAFFTHGEATAYPISLPDHFQLSPAQQQKLDSYLEKRFKGKFTMAGIQFWPEMTGLDDTFLQRAGQFEQIVPVFTNVIYDTSQAHANTIFAHMFSWLDFIREIIRQHPQTLFVLRAHPDEMRPGTKKQSRQSVRDWIKDNNLLDLSNVIFIDSQEYISSYELIRRAKFLMVYNSSIGLEATLLGTPVVCAASARYTQYPIVFLPKSVEEYRVMVEKFINADKIEMPAEFQQNARRFLYYQLYRCSLPFGQYLQPGTRPGFVQFRAFPWQQLLPQNSPSLKTIHTGILHNTPFLLDESDEYTFE